MENPQFRKVDGYDGLAMCYIGKHKCMQNFRCEKYYGNMWLELVQDRLK